MNDIVLSPEQEAVIADVTREVASAVASKNRGYVDAEDLANDGWVWALTHKDKIVDWLDRATPQGRARGRNALAVTLRREFTRTAEIEKANKDGYEFEDQHQYTRKQVAKLLPGLLCAEFHGFEVFDDSTDKVDGLGNPAEGNNHLVSVIDVRDAWCGDRVLVDLYGPHAFTHEELAAAHGVAVSTVYKWERRALDRMVGRLNAQT